MGSLSNLYISQSYQSLIHLGTNNTASATLIGLEDGLGNSIGVSVNTAGNLFLSGTFSASLQEGYLYVGNASGRTIAFPTSSLVTNINTGSLVTTSSFNAYTASTNIRLSNIEIATASILVSISNLNASSASQQISIDALNVFTASQSTASLVTSITNLNQFTQSQESFNSSATASIVALQNFSSSLDANFVTEAELAAVTGSLITQINTKLNTSSFNSYTSSNNQRVDSLESNSASVNTSITNINSFTQSANIRLNNLETTSASVNVSIANINSTTASQATSISNLNTSASLALTTASLSGQTLTFTKGDNSTFGIILPDVSGSDITALNQFTASQLNINTGYNTFTSSANQRLGSLETTSASVNTSISALNTFTASQSTASLVTSITELNTFSASAKISISALNTNSASVNTSISNLNSFTQSQAAVNVLLAGEIDALEAKTGSYATTGSNTFIGNQTITGNISAFSASFTYLQTIFESSSIIYSSGSNQFGDELTDIQTLSGSVKVQGSLTINGVPVQTSSFDPSALNQATASLQAFTQSANIRLNNLESTSASVNTSISNLNSFSSSQLTQNSNLGIYTGSVNTFITSSEQRLDLIEDFTQSAAISITNINQATASLFTSASLALVTASASGNTITFTKGNSSTFSVSVDTGSAATTIFEVVFTGENITKGDPLYISGSQGANPRVFIADAADPNKMPVTFISNETIGVSNTTNAIILGLIEGINLTGYVAGQSIYVAEGGGYSTSLPSGSNSITQLLGVITKEGAGGKGLVLNPGPAQLPGLDTGYMWAGNSNNQPIEITTASFASSASFNSYTSSNDQRVSSLETNSASVNTSITNINSATQSLFTSASLALVTGSVNVNVLTFTKGDGSTFDLTVTASGSVPAGTVSSSAQILNYGIFATTGSNTFRGNQSLISSSIDFQGSGKITMASGMEIFGEAGNISSLAAPTTIQFITEPPAGPGGTNDIKFINRVTGSSIIFQNQQGGAGNSVEFEAGAVNFNIGARSGSTGKVVFGSNTVSIDASSTTFTASLQQGYAWVGNGSGISVAVATSSFATTGSNTFRGQQQINSNQALTISGSDGFGYGITLQGAQGIKLEGGGGPRIQFPNTSFLNGNENEDFIFTGDTDGPLMRGLDFFLYGSGSQRIRFRNNSGTGANLVFQTTTGTGNQSIQFSSTSGGMDFNAGSGISITGSSLQLQGFTYPTTDGTNGQVLTTNGSKVLSFTTVSGSTINTGSLLVTASVSLNTITFTKGDASTFNITVDTGSGGGTTYINPTLNPFSGSLILVANTFTSSSFAHISASANGQVNLVFKNNNNTGTTTISGSGNIFTNPGAPTAGFKRYLTSGNLSLIGALPQISGNMAFSPTITGNIFAAALVTGNPITIRGPISSSTYTLQNNIFGGGTLALGSSATNNFQQAVNGVSISSNLIGGSLSLIANRTLLTQGVSIINNQIQGVATFNMNSSSIDANTSLFYGTNTFTNNSSGSSRVSPTGNAAVIYQSGFFGVNTMTFSGSNDPNDVQDNDYQGGIYRSLIVGSNSPFVLTGPTGSNSLSNTGIIGNNLIVTGSSGNPIFGGITTGHGSLFAGRFNAQDGVRERSSNNIFVVGTGTSTSARKTGFLIDSGSNTFIEGTLNVSGASTLNGNTIITGSLTLSSSAAIELDVIGNSQFTGSLTVSGSTIVTGSLSLSNVISFAQLDPLPTGADGQLAVSASNLWFYSGSAWNRVAFA